MDSSFCSAFSDKKKRVSFAVDGGDHDSEGDDDDDSGDDDSDSEDDDEDLGSEIQASNSGTVVLHTYLTPAPLPFYLLHAQKRVLLEDGACKPQRP